MARRARQQDYEACRLWRHAWEEVPSDWTPTYGGVPVTLRCMRCTMERRETWGTNTGERLTRRYVEPEGYYWHRDHDGDAPPTMDERRLAWIESHITEARKSRRVRAVAS